MGARGNLIRIQQTALDERGRTGGDINGEPKWHYACHVAAALYLIAEAIATGAAAIVDAIPATDPDAPESFSSDESGR